MTWKNSMTCENNKIYSREKLKTVKSNLVRAGEVASGSSLSCRRGVRSVGNDGLASFLKALPPNGEGL